MALIGFLIPHNSGEKISMYTTMMLSMSVYLTTITKFVPPASETSIVGTNGNLFSMCNYVVLLRLFCSTVLYSNSYNSELHHSIEHVDNELE